MSLVPSWQMVLVTPSIVKTDESRTGSGLFVAGAPPTAESVHRGVVEAVGAQVTDIEPGFVVHYLDFVTIGEQHIVSLTQICAWETP